jgi:hypothetical protein
MKRKFKGTLQIKISNRQIIKMYLGVRESMVLKRIPINRLRSSILERNNNYVINHDKPVLGGALFISVLPQMDNYIYLFTDSSV